MTDVNINVTVRLEFNEELENQIAKLVNVLASARYEYNEDEENDDED